MTDQSMFTLIRATARTPDELGDFALGDHLNAKNWTDNHPCSFDDAVFDTAFQVRQMVDEDEEWGLCTRVPNTTPFLDTLKAVKERPAGGDNTTARLIIMMHQRAHAIRTDAL